MFRAEDFGFVKDQIKHHQRQIDRATRENKSEQVSRHAGISNRFKDLLTKMEAANKGEVQQSLVFPEDHQIGHRFGDLSDLPAEIRSQLVTVQFDETEILILDVMRDQFNGIASIDEIFVALWRASQPIESREFLARKIYRMTTKALLYPYKGRKGVYSLVKSSDEEESAAPLLPAD